MAEEVLTEDNVTKSILDAAGIESEEKTEKTVAETEEEEKTETEVEQDTDSTETKTDETPKKTEADKAVEEIARSMGWVDKENFDDDDGTKKYVDAKTFILNASQIAHDAKRETAKVRKDLQEIKKTMNSFRKHQQDIIDAEVQEKMNTLEQEKVEAIKEGSVEEVKKIDEKINKIQKTTETQKETIPEIRPEVVEWQDRNDWYGEGGDPEMTAYADLLSNRYKGDDIDEMLEYVDKGVKKVFGGNNKNIDKTKQDTDIKDTKEETNKEKPKVAAVESTVNVKKDKAGNKKVTYKDLTRDQQTVCDRFVDLGVMTREEYVEELIKTGAVE